MITFVINSHIKSSSSVLSNDHWSKLNSNGPISEDWNKSKSKTTHSASWNNSSFHCVQMYKIILQLDLYGNDFDDAQSFQVSECRCIFMLQLVDEPYIIKNILYSL